MERLMGWVGIGVFMALVNGLLRMAHPGLSLERVLGVLFRPFALVMGVPWGETAQVGALLAGVY
jgi:nucleoside permease NupC